MAYVAAPYRPSEHRPMLEALWRDAFDPKIPGERVDARMRWLYDENPEGPPTTFVAMVEDTTEVIACATCLPRAMSVNGERLRSGILCDFAVDAHHRTAGAAIAVQRALARSFRENGYRFLFGFPNEASVAVVKRVGYKAVGTTATWVKPLRAGKKLRIARAPLLESPAARALDAGVAVFDRAAAAFFARGFTGEVLGEPDARFDRLWERARPRRGIAGERTSAYLTWRYARYTTQPHTFFALARRGHHELSGYAVYSVEDDRVILQDLFAVDFEESADALLSELALHLRARGAASIVVPYLGPAAFGARLGRLGYFKRPGARTMVALTDAASGVDARELVDPVSWFILDGELDI